jgi:hypothetical protein
MSHASVLIAVAQEEIKRLGSLELALGWQMEPFDEKEECFRDGSRWDWYVIGGRYQGKFYGNDVIRMADLDLGKLIQYKRGHLAENYRKAMQDFARKHDAAWLELVYDVKAEESEAEYIERSLGESKFPASYAFLRDRHWHEPERMGWFGASAYTECEIKAKQAGDSDVEVMVRRCLHKDEKTGARVICWNEPMEIWQKEFYRRFVEPLPSDVMLVNVDYHV